MNSPLTMSERHPIVVLISGSGSNLQAIIDAAIADLPVSIAAVISNKKEAFGLERARKAGVTTHFINHKDFASRNQFDDALVQLIDQYSPKLVVLAGFMRILGNPFVNHYQGRLLNIHPSLLPKYKGLNTHQRALDNGDSKHGASVHFVTPELDNGPIIAQAEVAVKADDSAAALAARVLVKEHIIYPKIIGWYTNDRVKMIDGAVYFDNRLIDTPIVDSI